MNVLVSIRQILLMCCVCAFANAVSYSQWVSQSTGTNDSYYEDVRFFDKDNGLIVSSAGSVYRTSDGGQTWARKVTSGGWKLAFIDNVVGFTWSSAGSMYKTTDAGRTWALFSTDLNLSSINAVYFSSSSIGYAVGSSQLTYKTINGGANWTKQTGGFGNTLLDVFFKNDNLGWAVGKSGTVVKTTDGGTTWTSPGYPAPIDLISVQFVDANRGWTATNGTIYLTVNGGSNWTPVTVTGMYTINKLSFIDANNGWIAGSNIAQTTDGGLTWQTITTPTTAQRQSISIVDSKNIWSVGIDQQIVTNTKRILVVSPNGGESVLPNSVVNIGFAAYNVASLKLEYSLNNGTTWQNIVNTTPSTVNPYPWTAPDTVSAQCRVRISNSSDVTLSDQSDNVFTIKGIRLQSPNGGEVWPTLTHQSISWIAAGIASVKLEYSVDKGISWQSIVSSISAGATPYDWTVPNTPSDQCTIRISDALNSATNDVSANPFTIKGIVVTSPNGNESWIIGSTQQVQWKAGGISNVKLEYTANNGTTWQPIVISTPANALTKPWQVPNSPSSLCRVRISDASNGSLNSQSLNTFTIVLGVPALVKPTNRSQNLPTRDTLVWGSVAAATKYQLQVSTDSNMVTNVFVNLPAIADTFYVVSGLANKTTFFWRVLAGNDLGAGQFSSSFRFATIVNNPAVPALFSPSNNSIDQPRANLLFRWSRPADVLKYRLQIAKDLNFSANIFYDDSTLIDTIKTINGLDPKSQYYWHVGAANVAGWSAFSDIFNFATLPLIPETPIQVSPASGEINQPASHLVLRWRKSQDAASYHLQVSTDVNFKANLISDDSTLVDTTSSVPGLSLSTTYSWRLSAKNAAGSSTYSSIWFFTTILTGVDAQNLIPNKTELLQNYPNPFNPSTIIRFSLRAKSFVSLNVYNTLGQIVARLVFGEIDAGYHDVRFDAGGLASGVYLYRIQAGSFEDAKRLLVVR